MTQSSSFHKLPGPIENRGGSDKYHHFLLVSSWIYCPRCGRRSADGKPSELFTTLAKPCTRCDLHPVELQTPLAAGEKLDRLSAAYYVTPDISMWPRYDAEQQVFLYMREPTEEYLALPSMLHITTEEAMSLAFVKLYITDKFVNAKGSSTSSIGNRRKLSVIRAEWRSDVYAPLTKRASAAYEWLYNNNATYRYYAEDFKLHQMSNEPSYFKTAKLLLSQDGIEVAARPHLYPWASMGDTGIAPRLLDVGRCTSTAQPSIRTSFARKLSSRVADYSCDFKLQCLIYDIYLARSIYGAVKTAEDHGACPDAITGTNRKFDSYWLQQREVLVDRCRLLGYPNLFITIAPAEWAYPLHSALLGAYKSEQRINECQGLLTIHLHRTLLATMDDILRTSQWFTMKDYSLRVEFQARGTLHIHLCAWVDYNRSAFDLLSGSNKLSGRSGQSMSPLLTQLEETFQCRNVDIQADGDLTAGLMQYVTGYTSKASDALQWKAVEYGRNLYEHKWLTTYRLLCKRSPCQPEMFIDFYGYPCMKHTFEHSCIYAVTPWYTLLTDGRYLIDGEKPLPTSSHRCYYEHYLKRTQQIGVPYSSQSISFLEYCRLVRYDHIRKKPMSWVKLTIFNFNQYVLKFKKK